MKQYKDIFMSVMKMKMDCLLMLFVKGRAGIGKSYQIKKALDEMELPYKVVHKVTEARLPEILYDNRERILWFKDVVRLFNNPVMIDMIKACAESDKKDGSYQPRRISVHNYSDELRKAGVPEEFDFNGKFIFDYNEIRHVRYIEDFNALLSRGEVIELVFDKTDMARVMRKIAKTDKEKEVTKYLINNHKFIGHNFFNLRTQQKAFDTFTFCEKLGLRWKSRLKEELKRNKSPIKAMLFQYMGKRRMRISELKKQLVQAGHFNTLRTADRRVNEWLEMEEIVKVSGEIKNFYVKLGGGKP